MRSPPAINPSGGSSLFGFPWKRQETVVADCGLVFVSFLAAAIFVGMDDLLHERVPDHIFFGEVINDDTLGLI